MASLSTKVALYCTANSKTADFGSGGNVTLQDDSDGKGPYIASWNVDGLDKPTDSQLANYETVGNAEETNNTVRATRKAVYGDIGDQLDQIYWDKKNGTTNWEELIDKIKADNPKPE